MKKTRKCRLNRNILNREELRMLFAAMPEPYRRAIREGTRIRNAAAVAGKHKNSVHHTIQKVSKDVTGIAMTFPGVKRSLLLQELILTRDWIAVEKKYGHMVMKTACAEFVRSYPKCLVDNLAC